MTHELPPLLGRLGQPIPQSLERVSIRPRQLRQVAGHFIPEAREFFQRLLLEEPFLAGFKPEALDFVEEHPTAVVLFGPFSDPLWPVDPDRFDGEAGTLPLATFEQAANADQRMLRI